MSEYVQMSLFDWIKPVEAEEDINVLTEKETVGIINSRLGVNFEFVDSFWGWELHDKKHKIIYRLAYDYYAIGDYERFIAVDMDGSNFGSGNPCDSIQEAIEVLKERFEEYSPNLLRR